MKPPSAHRRERARREARRAILHAAEALLVETGGDFSMRKLADRCGSTPPAVYHYFADKDALLDALLEERFAALPELLEHVDIGPDPEQNLRAICHAFLEFGESHPVFYRLIRATSRAGDDRTPPRWSAPQCCYSGLWPSSAARVAS